MRLYHFAPLHLFASIQREGLTLGCTPVQANGKIGFMRDQQWLTKNPSFSQSWCEGGSLPYDRTAVRIEISIPKSARSSLVSYHQLKAAIPEFIMPHFDEFGDPENWMIFLGRIPPGWFRRIEYKQRRAA